IVVPVGLFLASVPFGAGAFGMGDVYLLVGVGLMLGLTSAFTGLLSGLLAAGLVLVVLLAARRIGRRTYVPYGPFLIFGALWGIFVRV
ncbi:MAG TPA: prepilin peptidase, partial [Verrucomicrobiae bacterium]|nr:prepilin peptidase [Verrucomicrobiae bacterium]